MVVQEEQYLAHYGIPGMKWGKRKARVDNSSSYGKKEKVSDSHRYGKKGTERIMKDLKKGKTLDQARAKEAKRIHDPGKKLAVEGAKLILANRAYKVGSKVASKVLDKAVREGKMSFTTGARIAKGSYAAKRVLTTLQKIKMADLYSKHLRGERI